MTTPSSDVNGDTGRGDHLELARLARHISRALEPFVGCVYFAPECHKAYVALGFDPSGRSVNGVAMPDGVAYFTSRGSLMGQVHGNLVASAFAVFNPAVVVPAVARGWEITDASTIRAAREHATGMFLHRALDETNISLHDLDRVTAALSRAVHSIPIEGRPLFAGALSGIAADTVPTPDPLLYAWFLGDCFREARGDSHTAAWVANGLDAVEIGLLTEAFWGLPFKSYVRTRAWSTEQLDAGIDRLSRRGLVSANAITSSGRALRESIELQTDLQMVNAIVAMGADAEPVCHLLQTWSESVRAAHGYPLAGPQDLAATQTS